MELPEQLDLHNRAKALDKPRRAVCVDEGFTDNHLLKADAGQQFKGKGVVFKTV